MRRNGHDESAQPYARQTNDLVKQRISVNLTTAKQPMPSSTTSSQPSDTPLALIRNAWNRCLEKGPGDAWQRIRFRFQHWFREWRLGIDTGGSIDGTRLGHSGDSFGYQPIRYETLDVVFSHLPIRADHDSFLDYGCGKGRAVIWAARHPFARVIGVELSSSLAEFARHNVHRAQRHLKCTDVRVVQTDARRFVLPDDVTIVFMFNPFTGRVLEAVLGQIEESLLRRPREIRIVYALPNSRDDRLARCTWLETEADLPSPNSDWERVVVYRTKRDTTSPRPKRTGSRR